MFRRAAVLLAVVAAMLGPRSIVGAAEPIVQLLLQAADVQAASARVIIKPRLLDSDSVDPYGVRGLEGAQFMYALFAAGANKSKDQPLWNLMGDVYRAPDENGSKRLFAMGKKTGIGFESKGTAFGGQIKSVALPAYGDEQFACTANHSTYGEAAMVFVRKGTVVWTLQVEPGLGSHPTEAQMVEVLKTYAPKQQARVGAG
jgi:hypothetical protein